MSFERLRYDTCSYEQRLKETTSPGLYQLNTPANDCDPCAQSVPEDPYIQYQNYGPSACVPGSVIDDHSELLGITRRASDCPTQQYLRREPLASGRCGVAPKVAPPAKCRPLTEPTRLSNPPCTLRGTGINRWQWLPENPQDHALRRFEWNVDYRQVAKDNHRPCLYTPAEQTNRVLPTSATNTLRAVPASARNFQAPGAGMTPHWRSCEAISAM